MAAWCEGLALAKKDGVDLNMLHQVISTGGANSGMFQIYAMQVLNGDFAPAMSLINAQKDVDYYRHWAEKSGLSPTLSEAVLECFARASEAGFGEQGAQAVIRPMEAELGVEARLN
jgi:3-hydroxyisobutyrate dehydrogenase-like beta-hydroxyacid dehydrogenase